MIVFLVFCPSPHTMEVPPTPSFARPAVNMLERQHFNWTQNRCESRPPLISTQKALQRDVNLRGRRDMKAEQMRPPAPRSVTSRKHPGKVGGLLLLFRQVRERVGPPPSSVTRCQQPVSRPLPGGEPSLQTCDEGGRPS